MTDNDAINQAIEAFHNLSAKDTGKLQDLNTKIQNHNVKWGVTKGGEKTASGAIEMYWVDKDPLIHEFITFMDNNSLLPIFNWTEWDEGTEFVNSEDPTKYDSLELEMVLKVIYAVIRKDRFSDGTLAWAFESDCFPKLINRLVELGTTRLEL